jgi:hypothetical protein
VFVHPQFFLKIVRKLFAMNRWLQTGTLKKQLTVTAESPEEPKPGSSNAGIVLNLFKNKVVTQPLVFLCFQSHSKLTSQIVLKKYYQKTRAMQEKKTRRYDENYIAFGFMEVDNNCPQCVLCNKVLPNSSMFPAKLLRHFQSLHSEYKNKPVSFFVRKRELLLKSKIFMRHASQTVNENATEASYKVAYKIAMAGEAHTIAENLIKPCAVEMVKCMLDEKAAKELLKIPLSNDTVARRIRIHKSGVICAS